MLRSVRQYSSNANPGFLSELLARIENIPERAAQKKAAQSNANSAAKERVALKTEPSQRSKRVVVADHPLALFNDRAFSNRRFNNNNNDNNNNNNNNNGDFKGKPKRAFGQRNGTPRPPRQQRTPRRIVSNDKRVREQTADSSKTVTPVPSVPKLDGTALFHGRSSKLNHSLSSRVASVSKEILLESEYPFHFPQEVVQNAPPTASNFLLNSKYNTSIINTENLTLKLNTKVLGKIEEINLDEKSIPSGLKNHAIFAKKAIQNNADLPILQKQRVYDVVSGIKPVSYLVEECHWIKK